MNMKKVLAVILAMSVMLTIFVLPAAAVDEVESENDSSVVVHYYNVDGWYAFRITKYASAKVMFNDGTNQIPAQNAPGLDAEGIMWYKNGVWVDSETDTDEDELPDYMELMLGTNLNSAHSDADGLPDGFEVLQLGTDPLEADTDGNGVSDANEDADGDGLSNLQEYQLGTDPQNEDSDYDGLTDGAEVNTHHTDPTVPDTDEDGASDGWEVENNFDPLTPNATFNMNLSIGYRDDEVAPSVSINGITGEQAESLSIEQEENNSYYINDTVGAVGNAYHFEMNGTFENTATISFEFDSDLLEDEDFEPVIYYFNEEDQVLEALETTVVGNKASAQVEHFSYYILIDEPKFSGTYEFVEIYAQDKNHDYDKIDMIFVLDDSATSISSAGVYDRNIITSNIANALPGGSKVGL
ncbi:MAG: hypothetical protein IJ192_13820, partial [Clostridia bacterium]|nr:hypothetical protein [Clostridia bacterium]